MEIPGGTERMKDEAVEEDACRQVVDVVVDGQERSQDDVAAFHKQIGYGQPKQRTQEVPRRFANIHQVAGDEQEARHVEGKDHLLGVGVQMLEIYQMETDDKQDENPLQVVKFQYALHDILYVFATKVRKKVHSLSLVVHKYFLTLAS